MATDQEIRDRGIKFLPPQKYLQNPYEFPVEEEAAPVVDQGITNTNAFTGSGGDGFSVYNPDPNSIVNREYRPNYDYRQFSEYGSDPSMEDIKQMDINQNYFYGPPPSKLQGLLSMVPGAGIARFLKNQIGPYLPTNRRSIMENELGRKGIMVNDIGQIVQGDGNYNTAENIMAGYNANKVTQKTIDKRKETINKSLGKFDKYDKSSPKFDQDKYNQMQDKLKALDGFSTINNLTNKKVDEMEEFEDEQKKKLRSKTILGKFLSKKKEKKAAADAKAAAETQAAVTMQTNNFVPPSGITGGGRAYDYSGRDNQYGTHDSTISAPQAANNRESRRGGNDGSNSVSAGSGGGASYGNSAQTGAKDGYGYGLKKGGRAGYFFGGRVNYKKGGRGRTDAESQYGADSVGSYDSSQNKSGRQQSYGGNDTKQPALLVKKVDTIDTSGLKSKSPEINIDYTDPRNYASLKGSIYNTNILDNDNINVDGTLSGEIGPVGYSTNFTDQGITNTNLTAGNFNADIDANKNYSLGYANNYNGIDYGAKYDNNGNLMFSAGVNFKNGGLAGIL